MNDRSTAGQRSALSLVALLLVLAGGFGLALGFGAFGATRRASPVLPDGARTFAREQPWFWWAVAAGCVLLAVLGLRWLLSQLRTDGIGRLDLTSNDKDGVTRLHAAGLTDAVADETAGLTGVTAATAHLRERRGRFLHLRVDLADYADIGAIRTAIEQQIVPHARQAVDDLALAADIELRPTSRVDTRVR